MEDQRDRVLNTLSRYLRLCDVPVAGSSSGGGDGELGALFTGDAVWEGAGPEYAGEFGRVEGRAAIVEMLAAYLPPNPHFRQNLHLLLPGTIELAGATAHGSWLMQQLSRYASGAAELRVARLDVAFRLEQDQRVLISAFRTELLFAAALPAVPAEPEAA